MDIGNAFKLAHLRRGGRAAKALVTALFVFGAVGEASATSLYFDVRNFTDQSIVGMWVSPASSDSWGPEVRNSYVAPAGGTSRITLDAGPATSHTCHYDFQVLFAGGQERYWSNLDLCLINGISIDVFGGEVTGVTY